MLAPISKLLEDNLDMIPRFFSGTPDFTCGWACLRMLSDFPLAVSRIPSHLGLDTASMELYAARCHLHLLQLSSLDLGLGRIDEGNYLMLGYRGTTPHWFVLRITDSFTIVYDPAESSPKEYLHHDLPQAYVSNIITGYSALYCGRL